MDISYVVITDGKDADKTRLTLKSIHYQYRAMTDSQFEIILCGVPSESLAKYVHSSIDAETGARTGLVGAMRNMGADRARYGVIVFMDDDIVLNFDWLRQLLRFNKTNPDWSVLGGRLCSIDGTRFWDRCTAPPDHKMVPYDTPSNPALYQTSGLVCVKRTAFDQVRWAETARVHSEEPEDLLFSRDLHARGIPLDFNAYALAWHNDAKYTQENNVVAARPDGVQPCAGFTGNIRVIDR